MIAFKLAVTAFACVISFLSLALALEPITAAWLAPIIGVDSSLTIETFLRKRN